MPTAAGLPMPMSGEQGFATGFKLGDSLIQNLMNRQKMQQQAEQFAQELELRKQQEARLGSMLPLQQQMARLNMQKLEMELDPAKKMAYIQSLIQGIRGLHGQQMPPEPSMGMYGGQRIGRLETLSGEMPQPQASSPIAATPQGVQGFSPEEQMALSMVGIKFPALKETPEQKRFADLQSKLELEQKKSDLKSEQASKKELLALEKDLPTLEESLKGVQELKDIAQNNPDIFGHGLFPTYYAKTSENPAFGRWQNLLGDAIAGLESKLSSRGNIVALKMASQLKPSHGEKQPVALGKLDSMERQLVDRINVSRQKLGLPPLTPRKQQGASGGQYKDSDLVVVEGPNGRQTMTYAQAKQLGAR